ncbi:PAS domain-containing protein [Jatrophihabitans fulvus]
MEAVIGPERATGVPTSALDLAAVVDHVPAIMALFDLDLRNRFANWAHVPWLGLDPHDLIGASPADIVGPAVFAEAEPYYDAVREGVPQTFERIMTLPNGERRHALVNYVPYVVDGRIDGVVTLAADVTGRVRAEFARQELAARAAAIGEAEQVAVVKQRSAAERLQRMAVDLAAVAERHPDHAASVVDASRTMAEAAARLRALVAHRPGPGRPPGPERVVRRSVETAAARLGFPPSLIVLGTLDAVPGELAEHMGEVLGVTLDNVVRHASASRVDVTVGVEHDDLVVTVADDGAGVVRAQPGSGLDRLRDSARERGGRCSWFINADGGASVEWRVPLHPDVPTEVATATGLVARPAGQGYGPPPDYRTPGTLALDADEMRRVLDHLPMGLAVWDSRLNNHYANTTAARWLGLETGEQVAGRNYGDIVGAEAATRIRPIVQAALAGTQVVLERPNRNIPGSPRHLRSVFTPRFVAGRIDGLYVHVTDIGEQVRAESALHAEEARVEAMRQRNAAEEEVHHLAIQEVFAAAIHLDAVRPADPGAAGELDRALAPLDDAIADLRRSVVA